MCTISIESASFYFFTDTIDQYPNGPHFSPFFYVTIMGAVGAIFSLIGVYIYNKYMKNWKYRTLFTINNLIFMIVNLTNIIVYKRWNLTLGISDKLFVLGADAFQEVVAKWNWLPGIVILSQMCPDGVEATMYALLAGAQNFGSNLASYAGAYVLTLLKVQPNGSINEEHQFENLWIAALISSVLPCLPLILIPYLIPDCRQTDRLDIAKHNKYKKASIKDIDDDDDDDSKHILNSTEAPSDSLTLSDNDNDDDVSYRRTSDLNQDENHLLTINDDNDLYQPPQEDKLQVVDINNE